MRAMVELIVPLPHILLKWAVTRQKRRCGPLFDDPTILDKNGVIAKVEEVKPVGDDDKRPSISQR